MQKVVKIITALSLVLSIVFGVIYGFTKNSVCVPILITIITTLYHFAMRLLVGFSVDKMFNNKFDYNSKWFKEHSWEKKLYKMLNVKKWKNGMPTWDEDIFNPKKHSWSDIASATCQSEIVHEIIVVLSFLPIIASVWLDGFWVFFITSLVAGLVDLTFVVMQRYNRPRIIKIINKRK